MDNAQGNHALETPQSFAARVGLKFNDRRLLYRALTHRSYLNEHPDALEDNERLEFLGDAILDFLVGAWLYNHFPEMAEGDLTRLRSALVRTETLAAFAQDLDLGAALRLGKGEAVSGGRQRQALLCAAFEAMVGALYLDSGIEAVRQFVESRLGPAAHEILAQHKEHDPKSRLQEWIQAQGYGHPKYHMVNHSGPDHNKTFEVEVLIGEQVFGRGQGHSKQAAAKAAAKQALITLGLD